jgi:hypothetical protein
MAAQAQEDSLNSGRPEEERVTVWKATWIPVIPLGPADDTSGLCLDAQLASWPLVPLRRSARRGLSSIDPVREDGWQPLTD